MRRPDASMTLLTEVMARPLDGGYAEAAARREAGLAVRPRWTWSMVLAIALVLGLAVTWGVRVLRSPAESDQRARARLEETAEAARARLDALGEQVGALSAEVNALRDELIGLRDPSAAAAARELSAQVGAQAVTGPGVRVAITPDADAVAQGNSDARIRSGDLRLIVGALWQAGAEAVAVVGVRLTARSAIRDVG
ncbi:MAG: DUF881 domain-containing protein, partial [Bifidobacteriaceae bacterium]|nr:DUF881 domain-containing protein [Bifidobacteriaceae bacterium]